MGKIKLLSEATINKISAGEVIERPASIVKELIENSLDAGAKKIIVKLEEGGKRRVSVRDDGRGMSEEDLFASLERHATSKLRDLDDLFTISTMGFRGEAIPSIAAVTIFTISSAETHGDGFKITLKNGSISSNFPISAPRGTEIIADNLFYNLLPRKKFLKSDEREYAVVKETVLKFTIVYPEVSFLLFHNSRAIFSIPAAKSIYERISAIWKIPKESIGTAFTINDSVRMSAFIPDPAKSVPAISLISVNKRVVKDRVITNAIYKTFRETIGGEFKSPVILFIEIDPRLIDVNIHPAKLEIRFQNAKLIAEMVGKVIVNALESLRKSEIAPFDGEEAQTPLKICRDKSSELSFEGPKSVAGDEEFSRIKIVSKGNLIHGKILKTAAIPKNCVYQNGGTQERFIVSDKVGEARYVGKKSELSEEQKERDEYGNIFGIQIKDYRKIGLLFGVYIVVEMGDKVIFLDQHAAHERIIFTALKRAASLKSGLSQLLIAPLLIKLSPLEFEVLQEERNNFNDLGFLIERFDESAVILRAVPATGFEINWEKTIKETLGQLSRYEKSGEFQEQFMARLAQSACKAAIKKNDVLPDVEIEALIDSINKSEVLTCPHGRPFFFIMTKNEFEKRVRRR